MHNQATQRAAVIVALPAEIDFASQDLAYDRLYAAFAAGAAVVVADFTATTFCDCSSLRRLIAIQHRAAARDAQLRLAIPPGSPVRHTVHLMDLDHLLPVYPSARQAASAEPLPHLNAPVPRRLAITTATQADIIKLVGDDLLHILHWQAQLGELRRQRREPASRPALAATWDTLARLIDLHMRAEDEICVPAICERSVWGRDLAREIEGAHQGIREMIRQTSMHPPGSPQWWHQVSTALSTWTVQADREEHGPLADHRRRADPTLRHQLARQWQAFMDTHTRRPRLSAAPEVTRTLPVTPSASPALSARSAVPQPAESRWRRSRGQAAAEFVVRPQCRLA
ncbi:MAG: STAS domain-containing protein [Streptosporangiaceae bacterium]|nr:STAS domain-containing protein [Streptosporangiaceae bacterium]